jgi:hypothetical protein
MAFLEEEGRLAPAAVIRVLAAIGYLRVWNWVWGDTNAMTRTSRTAEQRPSYDNEFLPS